MDWNRTQCTVLHTAARSTKVAAVCQMTLKVAAMNF